MEKLKTPILFIIFNRPKTTEAVFGQIKSMKPTQLFIAADGPRSEKNGEKELCEETRKIITKIDWPCEIKTLFREKNLGCKLAVSEAISWFFDNVEQGIILEDDCVPNKSFFSFCERMLEKYKTDEKIMMVSGTNYLNLVDIEKDYFFSRYFSVWGWATWKRAWNKYDISMTSWPQYKKQRKLREIFKGYTAEKFYEIMFDQVKENRVSTWDIQWAYTCLFNNGLSCTPKYNLIKNIGQSGTHINTKKPSNLNLLMDTKEFSPSLDFQTKIEPDEKIDEIQFKNLNFRKKVLSYYFFSLLIPLVRKLRRFKNLKNKAKKLFYAAIISIPHTIKKPTEEKRLLIVKTDAIGDYVLFRNFLENIRNDEKYKEYKITLCGNESWKNLFENFDNKFADQAIWINPLKFRKNPFYIYRTIRKIKKINFDVAVNPMYSRTLQSDVLIKASNATKKHEWNSGVFTLSNKYQFEFDINKEFFEKLLNKKLDIKSPYFENIPEASIKLPEKFVTIFTGASDPKRQWGLENFVHIIEALSKEYPYKIVLVGGKKERENSEKITSILKSEIMNMTGKTSLTELVYIISKAQILISNDSSPVHIAMSTKTPTVCISNGNTFGRFTSCPKEIFDKIEYVYPNEIKNSSFEQNFDKFCSGSTIDINTIRPEEVEVAINKILK